MDDEKRKFVWGAATAAYQVEGAAFEGGKGLTIWDVFAHEKGRIYMDQNGDTACDSFHHVDEDVALMAELGITGYRFSIDWARVMPEGTGRVNEEGLAWYSHLVDALLEKGIEPFVTLYHWELPYALQMKGGWLNPGIADAFAGYAALIAERFSGRVKHYFTINEPQCVSVLGYVTGEHAPGLRMGRREFFQIHKNILLAHGLAVRALREHSRGPVKVGFAPCGAFYYPSSERPEDIEAARRATFHTDSTELKEAGWNVALFTDPVYFGRYPEETLRLFGDALPGISRDEWEIITEKLDFHGQNLYNGVEVRAGKDGRPERVRRYDGFPRTANGWPVTPEAMRWAIRFLSERYRLPIYITENGMSAHDEVSLDGRVHDPNRIDFMDRYLGELNKAVRDGADVAGYFVWSLMDNFEWTLGYSERFGIIYVDFPTGSRIPKDSFYHYQRIIRGGETQ